MTTSRPRDSQRSKVIAAADEIRSRIGAHQFRSIGPSLHYASASTRQEYRAASEWANARPWLKALEREAQARWRNRSHHRARGRYFVFYRSKLGSDNIQEIGSTVKANISPDRFDRIEALRYIAQTYIPADAAWHGPEFVWAFLQCIRYEIGETAYAEAVQVMRDHKVRRREMNPEVRARHKAKYESQQEKRAIAKLLAVVGNLKAMEPPDSA